MVEMQLKYDALRIVRFNSELLEALLDGSASSPRWHARAK
jgi:hypothetical protein